jgi:hypothetical protein
MARVLPVLALMFGSAAGSVFAQSPTDCGKAYDSMLQRIERQEPPLAPDRLAALRRRAQRIFDACRLGHVEDPRALFDRLDRAKD